MSGGQVITWRRKIKTNKIQTKVKKVMFSLSLKCRFLSTAYKSSHFIL